MKTGISVVAMTAFFMAGAAHAATVNSLDPGSSWQRTDMRVAGQAEIVDLNGAGGALEADAPLPNGALKLTTTDNADKAEVGTALNVTFGDVINGDVRLSYDVFVESTATGFAAPALKLSVAGTAAGTGIDDGFFTLVYEPNWNQSAGAGVSNIVPTGGWTTYEISFDSGVFWTTGGFGVANGAGGPPFYTLEDLLAAANGNLASATILGLSIGLGTFNAGSVGYVDNVQTTFNGVTTTTDFQVAAIPAPAALPLLAAALAGFGLLSRRRKAA